MASSESETEQQQSFTITLNLPLSQATMQSPEHPGMQTPPLQKPVAVPFKWEEEPGKAKPCTAIVPHTQPKFLDLPPRLYMTDSFSPTPCKMTKTPSPSTVLDGPYMGRPKFSSFRFMRERERQRSFDSSSSSTRSPESVETGNGGKRGKGVFGKMRTPKHKGGRRKEEGDVEEGSLGFSPAGCEDDDDDGVRGGSMKRNGSFSTVSQAKSHIWAAIYQGFKQVLPWKTKKSKKEDSIV